jgi:hypothetical protein
MDHTSFGLLRYIPGDFLYTYLGEESSRLFEHPHDEICVSIFSAGAMSYLPRAMGER